MADESAQIRARRDPADIAAARPDCRRGRDVGLGHHPQRFEARFPNCRGTQGMGYPLNSTLFYSVYLFQTGFQYLKIGYASAMAWVLFVIVLAVTAVQMVVSRRLVFYEGGSQ